MQSKPESLLSKINEEWKARGWSLADLGHFRMEDAPTPPVPPVPPVSPVPPVPPEPPAPTEQLFPPHTPVADMTPAQQIEYWKHHSRKHEARASERSDYDELKAKAAKYDTLDAASKTEQERALEQAKEDAATEARSKATSELAPKLVDAEMRAAAAGKLTPEQLAPLIENLDRSKFLTDTGDVDLEKVATFIGAAAPGAAGGTTKPGFPNLGQGKRTPGDKPTTQTGADRYAERHKTKTPPAS